MNVVGSMVLSGPNNFSELLKVKNLGQLIAREINGRRQYKICMGSENNILLTNHYAA